MKHKILLLLFLFSLLPSWGWGQEAEVKETIELKNLEGSYLIKSNGEYTFIGTYNSTPNHTIEGDENKNKAVINVAAGLEVTIILDNATINPSNGCPLCAKDASKVNLVLKGKNILETMDYNCASIWVPDKTGCGIIIDEDIKNLGSLTTSAATLSPGIGHHNMRSNSYIEINSGNFAINGGFMANDIDIHNGSITINGGNVNIINTYSDNSILCSTITINGGIITTYNKIRGTLSTGENGTAFINASNISDQSYKDNPNTKGLIFDGNKGAIYGDSYILAADATIESGKTLIINQGQTLTIAKGATLTIAQGATLTNNGTIKCDGEINGTISGDKKVKYAVTCNLNYDNPPKEYIEYVANGESVLDGKRDYYEFLGWFTQSEDGGPVTTITGATTVYAYWEPKDLKPIIPIEFKNLVYGNYFKSDITIKMLIANIDEVGGINSIELISNDMFKDLSYKNNVLTGTPIKVGNGEIRFKITAINGASAEAYILFKVNKANLTITPDPNQKIYEDETPAYTVTGVDNVDKIVFDGALEVVDGIVTQGNLALEAPFSDYCNIKFDKDVPIIILPGNASDVLAILPSSPNNSYTESVTFTAPEGFEIALVSSVTKSDAQLAYNNSFVWDKAGTHEVTYSLRRTAGNKKAYEHSVIVTVGKVSPPDVHPDKPDNTIPVTYKVSLPSVEGIHTNPVADNYDIEAWGSFKFTITIEEGYRMLSLPVVKVNDSKIAFSSRTDTTFTYIIEYIRTPKDIKITGIVKDPATANNAIKAPEENIKIINDVAYITVAKPTEFAVVDMNGNIISTNKLAPGETPIYNLPRAKPIVFWFDKERAVKVIIK